MLNRIGTRPTVDGCRVVMEWSRSQRYPFSLLRLLVLTVLILRSEGTRLRAEFGRTTEHPSPFVSTARDDRFYDVSAFGGVAGRSLQQASEERCCGGVLERCCAGGWCEGASEARAICVPDDGFASLDLCVPCGKKFQRCCSGDTCARSFVCDVNGEFGQARACLECGDWLRPCCKRDDGSNHCWRENTSCQGSSAGGDLCLECGDIDQQCCPGPNGTFTCRPEWQCVSGTCLPCSDDRSGDCTPLPEPLAVRRRSGRRSVQGRLGQACLVNGTSSERFCADPLTSCQQEDIRSPIGSLLNTCTPCGGVEQLQCPPETAPEPCGVAHMVLVPDGTAEPPNCQPCGEFGNRCCPGGTCRDAPYGSMVCVFASQQLQTRCMLDLGEPECKVTDQFQLPTQLFDQLAQDQQPFVPPPFNPALPGLNEQDLRAPTDRTGMEYLPALCNAEAGSSRENRQRSQMHQGCADANIYFPMLQNASLQGARCCNTGSSEGYVLHGVQSAPLLSQALLRTADPPLGAAPGRALVLVDVDGDGVRDLAFTDPMLDGSSSCSGVLLRIVLLDGMARPRAAERIRTITLQDAGLDSSGWFDNCHTFGQSLTVLGDVDGNGVQDLALGYPALPAALASLGHGGVLVLLMNANATLKASNLIRVDAPFAPGRSSVPGSEATPALGYVVAGVGDVNGDGVPDLLATSQGSQERGVQYWMIFLDSTGGVANVTSVNPSKLTFLPNTNNPQFTKWAAVEALGDINGDGIPDIAVSDPSGSSDGVTGAVWIITLARDGTPAPNAAFSISPAGGYAFGMGLHSPGDVNGDGINDLLVQEFGGYSSSANQTVHLLYLNGASGPKAYQPLARLRLLPWSEYYSAGSIMAWCQTANVLLVPMVADDNTVSIRSIPFSREGCFGSDGELLENGDSETVTWFERDRAGSLEECTAGQMELTRDCTAGELGLWIGADGSLVATEQLSRTCEVSSGSGSGGLSTGAIVGIIIPLTLALLALALFGSWLYKRQKDRQMKQVQEAAVAQATQKLVAAIAGGDGEINPAAIDVLIQQLQNSDPTYAPPPALTRNLVIASGSRTPLANANLLEDLRRAENAKSALELGQQQLLTLEEVVRGSLHTLEGMTDQELEAGSRSIYDTAKGLRRATESSKDSEPQAPPPSSAGEGESSLHDAQQSNQTVSDASEVNRGNVARLLACLMPVLPDVDLDIDPQNDIEYVRRLGRGAFGTVYEGYWTNKHGVRRQVAVKVMDINSIDDAKMRERHLKSFQDELDIMTRIEHENIVRCYGGCLRGNTGMLLLEFMDGGNIDSFVHEVRQGQPLNQMEVLSVANQVSAALAYLHPLVVHCDIKPQNIMLNSAGDVKIADFGLSKFKYNTVLTTHVGGTPAYTAPEVVEGVGVTEKCDMYSLGMVLWELATGQRPWASVHAPYEVYYLVRHRGVRPEIPPEMPPSLATLVRKLWAGASETRPTANEVFRKTQVLMAGLQVNRDIMQSQTDAVSEAHTSTTYTSL